MAIKISSSYSDQHAPLDILSSFKHCYWNSIAYEFVRSHRSGRATPNNDDAAIVSHT